MKETISNKQGIIIMILFMQDSALVVGSGSEAKGDVWLAILLGFVISLPAIYIYSKLLYLFPGKDLYDILRLVFGKVLGSLFILVYIWFSLHVGTLVLENFKNFVITVGLRETPKIATAACLMLLCAYGVKKGIEVIGRWAEFFFTFAVLILVLITSLSAMNFRMENVRPVLYNGIAPVISGAISFFSFPLTETVIFTAIFSSLQHRNSIYKVYFIGVTLGTLFLLIVSLVNVLVLGPYIFSLVYFPTYLTVARISIGEFLQRLESLVSVGLFIAGFVTISVCLLSASKGISKLFNFNDYRPFVSPMALLILNMSYFLYKNMMENRKYSIGPDHYYKFLINGIIPLIIFIAAKIKMRVKKRSQI